MLGSAPHYATVSLTQLLTSIVPGDLPQEQQGRAEEELSSYPKIACA